MHEVKLADGLAIFHDHLIRIVKSAMPYPD